MDAIEQLIGDAREKRNKAIAKARAEYRETVRQIRILRRALADGPHTAIRQCGRLTTVEAASRVLRECGPLTTVEITVKIMQRGHRAGDDPRAVARAVRSGLAYHRGRFRNVKGKWSLVPPLLAFDPIIAIVAAANIAQVAM